jgi:acyl carrier protein
LKNKFGIRLGDSKDFRRVVTTINNLATYVKEQNA